MSGVIAIVGRPNVGKSALFNRIVKRRIAIVHDEPGVTRDRLSAEAEWHGRPFTLVDTGGIGLLRREKAENVIVKATVEQVDLAVEAADVIILVVNVQEGVVPLDREVAARLRKSGKPVLVAVNKVDTFRAEPQATEFVALGFEKTFPVSAIHGEGIEALMDAAIALLPAQSPKPEVQSSGSDEGDLPESAIRNPQSAILKLAIVGRPNVGKSSIINALTNSVRVIVSSIPGTTRDSIDVPFKVETDGVRQKYVLIDTAGMRKTRRVDDSVEFFSVQRAEESIKRCDIVVLVLDAESGILEQDKKIADRIVEARKACILVVNKWDLFEESVLKAREEEIARRNRKDRNESPAHEHAGRIRRVGAGEIIFPRLRAGDFHLGEIGLPTGSSARSRPLRRGAVGAENSNWDFESHHQRRRRTSSTHQRAGPSAEIFLCHAGAAIAADIFVVRQSRRIVFGSIQKTSRRRVARGVRLRGLSDCAGAKTTAEDHRTQIKPQDIPHVTQALKLGFYSHTVIHRRE